MTNRVNTLLGTRYPIISAPMGGVAGGRLAAAVATAGGAGLVGVSYGNADFITTELPLAAAADGVWGAGLVMFTLDLRPELLDLVLSYRPPVVALSFGDEDQTRRFVSAVRREGLIAAVQVHDATQAVQAGEIGADLIIAQGSEAGGHHKDRSTFPLIPTVVDALDGAIPVIAAGGIADGRGLAAALALGAEGVMIGTRFAAATEALTSPGFSEALVRAHNTDLVDSRAFDIVREIPWPSQYTARTIENEFVRTWSGRDDELAARSAELVGPWTRAVEQDDVTQRPLFAGENVDLITSVLPAAEIVESLVEQADSILDRLGASSLRATVPTS